MFLGTVSSREEFERKVDVATLWTQVGGQPLAGHKAEVRVEAHWVGATLSFGPAAGEVRAEVQEKKQAEVPDGTKRLESYPRQPYENSAKIMGISTSWRAPTSP